MSPSRKIGAPIKVPITGSYLWKELAMNTAMISLVEINTWNREFWDIEDRKMERRIEDNALLETALLSLRSEIDMRVAVYNQKSLNKALQEAELAKQRFLSQQGQNGGRVHKSDPLQDIILDYVRRRPPITASELLKKLQDDFIPGGVIQEIGKKAIAFTNRDDRSKEAPISGLKDRLSRAKKKLASR
jgi:hypothetical protein